MDRDIYLQEVTAPLREAAMRSAIELLRLPEGSSGLDVGCGIGLQTLLLAEAVGSAGCVSGLDISPVLLEYAREKAGQTGLGSRLAFAEGNVNAIPFKDNVFDWAWSVDCVGYAPFNPLPAIKEMKRVVERGGRVILLAWSSEQILTGYPGLEARLRNTAAGMAPFVEGMEPEGHFCRVGGRLKEVGLTGVKAYTVAGNFYAPLSGGIRKALAELIEMRWSGVESEISSEDRAEFKRLTVPGSPDCILDVPDYYGFFIYSIFEGVVP